MAVTNLNHLTGHDQAEGGAFALGDVLGADVDYGDIGDIPPVEYEAEWQSKNKQPMLIGPKQGALHENPGGIDGGVDVVIF
jgi:hypothetical protein